VRASTLHIHAVESLFKSREAVLYNTGRLPALRSQQRATPPLSPNGVAQGFVAIILAMQHRTARRISQAACQACWQTAPRYQGLRMIGSFG